MIVQKLLKSIEQNQDGTTAVEFAIIAPVFMLLILGTIALCFALFLVGSLHFAVEDGARCASVKTTICTDATSTIAYTQRRYLGAERISHFHIYLGRLWQLRERVGQLFDERWIQDFRHSDLGYRLLPLRTDLSRRTRLKLAHLHGLLDCLRSQ